MDDQSLGAFGKTSGLQNLGSSVVHCRFGAGAGVPVIGSFCHDAAFDILNIRQGNLDSRGTRMDGTNTDISIDLIDGPFAVIESDPGLSGFVSLQLLALNPVFWTYRGLLFINQGIWG